MKIVIKDKPSRRALDFLRQVRDQVPSVKIIREKTYRGIVVNVEDEDEADDFTDLLTAGGFAYELADEEADEKRPFKMPKADIKLLGGKIASGGHPQRI